MSAVRALASFVAFACVLLVGARAEAHAVGLSQATYAVNAASVEAQMTLARGEMLGAVPELDPGHTGAIDQAAIDAARPALARIFATGLEVTRDGAACPVSLVDVAMAEEDGLRLTLRGTCPDAARGTAQVNAGFLDALSHGHRQIAKLGGSEQVLFRDHTRFDLVADDAAEAETAAPAALLRRSGGASLSFFAFVRMGIEHILSGYDHLLFLFALILVGGRFRSVALVITAFTVAHSVSLAAAALGLLAPSPRIVEPAIALSIAYVGVENFVVKDAKKRWRLTLFFGLIHGFGFAGALQEISLPRAQVPVALLGFNLGVEAGQLAVLAVVLPAVLWLRKRPAFRVHGVRLASAAVVVLGVVWFVQRAFFTA